MTQIGMGSARHRLVLPDNTQIDIAWSAITHTGYRREVNEDSFIAQPPVFAVADGMGGHAAGDVASSTVVTWLGKISEGLVISSSGNIEHALHYAVQELGKDPALVAQGSGTTVTGITLASISYNPVWVVFNIGDSRVYRLKGETLEQLTTDHSVVQQLVDAGQITRDEADFHPHSNVITRAVGFHEPPVPDYRIVAVEAGTRILICSDGLTKELTDFGIQHFMMTGGDATATAEMMMNAALGNGGRDNVTVIVVDLLQVLRGDETQAVPTTLATGEDAGHDLPNLRS